MNNEIRALLSKESRQLMHKPGAVASAVLFPFFFLLVIPGVMMIFGGNGGMTMTPVGGLPFPTAMSDELMNQPGGPVASIFLPLYVGITGLVLPSILAIYSIVSEKEKKTIDLLLALPVSLGDIMLAKLISIIGASLIVTLPLLFFDLGLLAWQGFVDPVVYAGLVLELLAALAFASASAIVLGLVAKDYRTANNMSGFFMGPLIPVTMAFAFLVPNPALKLFALSVLFLVLTVAILWVAINRISLERMAL